MAGARRLAVDHVAAPWSLPAESGVKTKVGPGLLGDPSLAPSAPSILGGIGLQHALAVAHQCADAWREIASWSRCHQRRQQRARLQRGYPCGSIFCRICIWACRACRPRRKAPAWCAIHVATAPGRRSNIRISIPVCASMSLDTGRNKSKQKDVRVLSAARGPSLDR